MTNVTCDHLIRRGGWAEEALRPRCTFPIGPRNTWSNTAYIAVGATLLLTLGYTPQTAVMAGALTMLGIGSGLYHGFKTIWANRLDHVGMYLVFGALSVYGIMGRHAAAPYLMLVTGALLAGLFTYTGIRASLDIQMGVLFYFTMLPAFVFGDAKLAGGALALFLLGFGAWQLDKRRSPLIGLWGHALWHLLTAPAIGMMYLALYGGTR
jgi:predicted membrane channel-forming protein YqfA (hemolysin III family)